MREQLIFNRAVGLVIASVAFGLWEESILAGVFMLGIIIVFFNQ